MSATYDFDCECDNFEMMEDQDAFSMNEGIPGPGVPAGGSAGQILQKRSQEDYDTEWVTPDGYVPAGGSAGQILKKSSAEDYDTEWDSLDAGDVSFDSSLTYAAGSVGKEICDVKNTLKNEIDINSFGANKNTFTVVGYDKKIYHFTARKGITYAISIILSSSAPNNVYTKITDGTTDYSDKTISTGYDATLHLISPVADIDTLYVQIGSANSIDLSVEVTTPVIDTDITKMIKTGIILGDEIVITAKTCINGVLSSGNVFAYDGISILFYGFLQVIPSTIYKVNNNGHKLAVYYYDDAGTFIKVDWFSDIQHINTPVNCRFIRLGIRNASATAFDVDSFSDSIIISEDKESNSNQISGNALIEYDELPNYYKEIDWENSVSFADNSYIDSKIESIPDGKHFIFVTDMHWDQNAKKSPLLMQYVRQRKNIKNIVFGGDIFDRFNTKYKALAYVKNYMQEMKSAFGSDYIVAGGNHDLNTANVTLEDIDDYLIPYTEIVPATMGHINGTVYFNEDAKLATLASGTGLAELKAYMKMHYYVDDDQNKIRYIVLQTGNGWQRENGVIYDYFDHIKEEEELYLQINFMEDALMTLPPNYDVVVCGHMWMNQNGAPKFGYVAILRLLIARKNNLSVNLWISNAYPESVKTMISGGNHTYNFTSLPKCGEVIVLGGHWHYDYAKICALETDSISVYDYSDYAAQQYNNWIPVVTTQCDAYAATVNGSSSMTINTVTEQCFDVVTLSDDGHVYFTRFGSGNDREFLFE